MPFAWPIPTMKGQSRLTIKTHAAFGVGIKVRYEVISSNNPQFSSFWIRVQSGRFAGFSGSKKEQSEPFKGLFYPGGSGLLPGSWFLSDDIVEFVHASENEGFIKLFSRYMLNLK